MKRIFKSKINIVILFLSIFVTTFLVGPRDARAAEKSTFWVEYVDVGQGDCALIQCDGHYMMIDGGPSKASSTVYTILKNKGIKTIDLMIATHPDEDHIGGLSGALNYSSVDTVLSPVVAHDTKTFNSLSKYVTKQGKTFTVPKAGDSYALGSSRIDILGPIYSNADTNNQSIVVKVTYGLNSFIFTGDAEEEEENSIIRKYKGLNCDVLKVAHHGSNSSTSKAWLNATKPTYAVIPVGQNSYGHPTQNTIDKLTKAGAVIYRTDLHGDITFTSDGKNLSVQTEKNASSFDVNAGDGKKDSTGIGAGNDVPIPAGTSYVLNTNSKKFHVQGCGSVKDMNAKNMQFSTASADELMKAGYKPCQRCCSSVTTISNTSSAQEVAAVTAVASTQAATPTTQAQATVSGGGSYVLNTNSKKFHYPSCSSVGDMSSKNRRDVSMSRDEIIAQGFVPCKRCNP